MFKFLLLLALSRARNVVDDYVERDVSAQLLRIHTFAPIQDIIGCLLAAREVLGLKGDIQLSVFGYIMPIASRVL